MIQRIQIDLELISIIGHIVLWIILIIITVGVALFFLPYSFPIFILKRVYLLDDNGKRIGKLEPEVDLASQIGHIIIWLILSLITLGFAYIIYLYKTWAFVLSRTRIVSP